VDWSAKAVDFALSTEKYCSELYTTLLSVTPLHLLVFYGLLFSAVYKVGSWCFGLGGSKKFSYKVTDESAQSAILAQID
jgi:hypothetical protein